MARERKRREIEPAIEAICECLNHSVDLIGEEAKSFRKQMKELQEFLEMGEKILGKLGRSEKSTVLKWMLKMM